MDERKANPTKAASSTSLSSVKRKDDGCLESSSSQPTLKVPRTEHSNSLKFVLHTLPHNVRYSKIESFFSPFNLKAINVRKAYGPLKLVEVTFSSSKDYDRALAQRDGLNFHFSNSHLPCRVFLRTPQQTQADIDDLPTAFAALPDTVLYTIFSYFDYCTRIRLSRVCKKWKNELRIRITPANKIMYLNYTDVIKVPTFPKFDVGSGINHLMIRGRSYAAFKALKLWKFLPRHVQITKLTLSHSLMKSWMSTCIPPSILDDLWAQVKYIRLLNCNVEIGALVVKVSRGSQLQAGVYDQVTKNNVWCLRITCPEVVMQATTLSDSWLESLIGFYQSRNLLWTYKEDQTVWLSACLSEIRKNDPEHMMTIQNYVNSEFAQRYADCDYLRAPAKQSVTLCGRRLNKLDMAMIGGFIVPMNRTIDEGYSDYSFSKKLPAAPSAIPDHFIDHEGYPRNHWF